MKRLIERKTLIDGKAPKKGQKSLWNLGRLLEDSPEAYYWNGFILADGYINDKMRLRIQLALKDEKHLEKFCVFAGIGYYDIVWNDTCGKLKSCMINALDKKVMSDVVCKYDLKHNKTENPPQFPDFLVGDALISYLIGYIDGDGCITRKQEHTCATIVMKGHGNWLQSYNDLSRRLHESFPQITQVEAWLNGKGYSCINFSKYKDCIAIKEEAIRLGLPIMERKWDKIDVNYKPKYGRNTTVRRWTQEELEKLLSTDLASALTLFPYRSELSIKTQYWRHRR